MDHELENYVYQNYNIIKRIGKGAYGIVWKAKNKRSGINVALKKIFDAFRNQTDAQRTFREIAFLQEFSDHPNIIRLLNVIRAENNKDIYLVFQYMETDLHKVIKRGNILKDVHKKYITYQLLKAVKYIHSGNVIHRDLKPSNLLLDSECNVKVCDFGLTRSLHRPATGVICRKAGDSEDENEVMEVGDPGLTEYVATRWYRAPEILLSSTHYTKGIDIWSIGCIMAEMFLGKPLFPGSSTLNQLEKIMAVGPRPTREDIDCLRSHYGVSLLEKTTMRTVPTTFEEVFSSLEDPSALDLVKSFLVLNPNKRLTAEQALSHKFIQTFRDPNSEIVMRHSVVPVLSDSHQLSISEYRSKLYEMIMTKKAERRNRRTLMTKGNAGNSETDVISKQDSVISSDRCSENLTSQSSSSNSNNKSPSALVESSDTSSASSYSSSSCVSSTSAPSDKLEAQNKQPSGNKTKTTPVPIVSTNILPIKNFQNGQTSKRHVKSVDFSHKDPIQQTRTKSAGTDISQSDSQQKCEKFGYGVPVNGVRKNGPTLANSYTIVKNNNLGPLDRKFDRPHANVVKIAKKNGSNQRYSHNNQDISNLPFTTFSQSLANPTVTRTNPIPSIRTCINSGLQRQYLSNEQSTLCPDFQKRHFQSKRHRSSSGVFPGIDDSSKYIGGRNPMSSSMDRMHVSHNYSQAFGTISQSQLNRIHSRPWIK